MARLADLFKYKTKVQIKGQDGSTKATVWLRVIGDEDLNNCYKLARIASAQRRKLLRQENSPEYLDEIAPIEEMEDEDLRKIVRQSKETEFTSEAYVMVNREDLPKIEDIAVEPDAPSLEEQEILDGKLLEIEMSYQTALKQYVQDRLEAFDAELSQMSKEDTVVLAKKALANILPLRTFADELIAQKIFHATYQDEPCTKREFRSVDEFKEAHRFVKEQLIEAYNTVELATDDIKN